MKLYAVLMAGLVACGMVMAQEGAATGTAPATTEKSAPAKKAPAAKAHLIASATVVSIDAMTNTVIVEVKKGKKVTQDTLTTTDKTVVSPKSKTLADLKAGDKVSVSYKVEEGKMVASKISAIAAPKAKAAAKKEAAPEAPKAGEAK